MGKSSGIGHIVAALAGVVAIGGRMCSKVDDVARVGLRSVDNIGDASRYGRNADAFDDYLRHADELQSSRYADEAAGLRHADGIRNGLRGQSVNNLVDLTYDRMIKIRSNGINKSREMDYMREILPEFNTKIDAIYDDALYKTNPELFQSQIDELVEEFRTPEVIKYMAKSAKLTKKTLELHKLYNQERRTSLDGDIDLQEEKKYTVGASTITIPAGFREVNSIQRTGTWRAWMDTNVVITLHEFGWSTLSTERHLEWIKVNGMTTTFLTLYEPKVRLEGNQFVVTMRDQKRYGIIERLSEDSKIRYLEIESEDEEYIKNSGEKLLKSILGIHGT